MFKRLITGILFVAIIAGFIALRMVHTAFFDAFVLILMIIAGFEVIKARKLAGKTLFERLIIFYPIPVCAGYVFTDNILSALLIQLLSIVVILLISVGIELIIYGVNRKVGGAPVETQNLLSATKDTMMVILYPLTIISFMFMLNHFGYNLGYVLIIVTFAVSIITDTFAYLFGMWLGRNKARFAPEISPKKSMAGAIAGIIGGFIAGIVCWLLFYHFNLFNAGLTNTFSTAISLTLFSFMGILGSIATQFGDLIASAVKRKADLKDYGKILPGHGGIMDRIDGEIFCGAIVALLFAVFLVF